MEALIGVCLLGLVVVNVYMVLGRSAKTYGEQTGVSVVDAHVRRTLDRVALALVGASRSTLFDVKSAPFSSSDINYQTCLGVQDGQVVWSNPQRIALTKEHGRQVTWFENPAQAGQRRVAWSNWVTEWLLGEELNGIDDNGNGLQDEKGLSFDVDGNSVIIRLTVEKPGPDGTSDTRMLKAVVTCRN